MRTLLSGSSGHHAANVEEIIGDHAESDPALHPKFSPISGAVEPVSPFNHASPAAAHVRQAAIQPPHRRVA